MIKKPIQDKDLDERYQSSMAKVMAETQFLKTKLRDEFAIKVMAGMCAGDWKFDTSEKTWDQVASKRAYEIADAMLNEREITNV